MHAKTYTIEDLLKMAIQREIASQYLYKKLVERVTHSGTQYVLGLLIQQEKEHQLILEKYLQGNFQSGVLDLTHTVDYHIAENFDQPEINTEMDLPVVFLLAANREKEAHEFYQRIAGMHPPGGPRALLEKLANEELGHKQNVEQMYTEVAFPQTDGG
jgi:rubrerythrin